MMRIVFDLDGTLIDSMRDLADSANEMVQGFGGVRLDDSAVASMVGDGAAELVRRALAGSALDVDQHEALRRFLQAYDRRLLHHTRPYPGMKEVLTLAARRHQLAVLTNKPTLLSKKVLAGLGLAEFFDRVLGGDGPYPRKPDPEGLRALMTEGSAHTTALIGDSPIDEATARAAGCHFVFARYGFGSARFDAAPPDTPFVLERATDLPAIIERLELVASGA
jgi:phosphoglycolate phosphatase